MDYKTIPIRLSHSSLDTLHSCERKWQLEKLLVDPAKREENEHTVFGKAYGVGIATYLTTQDTEQALFHTWLAYNPEIQSEKKSLVHCFVAVQNAFQHLDTLLMDWEVAYFNGKPAIELSFRIKLDEEYYFVGHIDVVMRNRRTGVHAVFDAKSTGLQLFDLSPLYQYSGQVLGYSVALDRIVGEELSSYDVGFIVAQLNAKKYTVQTHVFTWTKTIVDRLKWFMTLGLDLKHMREMQELNHYPMRANSCLTYNRPCRYFGICHLHSTDEPAERVPDPIKYDFSYSLDELINDHLARIPSFEIEKER